MENIFDANLEDISIADLKLLRERIDQTLADDDEVLALMTNEGEI